MDSVDGDTRDGVTARFLFMQDGGPALELIEVLSDTPRSGAPLLFIHGAFGGAWMWRHAFLPCAAGRGRAAAAVSLRGHGKSDGYHLIGEATLADYARDIRRALAEFSEPPIVIAHSLGALLAQRLLGRARMRALVMLTPLPPEGLLFTGLRVLLSDPELWIESIRAASGSSVTLRGRARQALFSNRFSEEEIDRHLSLMVAEGARVLLDAQVPRPTIPAFLLGIPTFVIAGGDDRIVTSDATWRTALYHGADHLILDGAGHLLNVEPGAEKTAHIVLDWIERKGM